MPNREQFEAAYRAAFPSHGFNTSNLFVSHDGLYGHAHIQVAWKMWQAGAAAERQKKPNLTMTITPAMGATITAESGCTVYPGDVFQLFKVGDRSAP